MFGIAEEEYLHLPRKDLKFSEMQKVKRNSTEIEREAKLPAGQGQQAGIRRNFLCWKRVSETSITAFSTTVNERLLAAPVLGTAPGAVKGSS